MSIFTDFIEEEIHLIVSLPYRVGLWISHADDVEGGRDDAKEHRALEAILQALAKSKKQHPFVRSVMHETLDDKKLWDVWRGQQASVLDDVSRVIAMLRSVMDKESVQHYRRALWQVARVVAQAYGEHEGPDDIPEALIVHIAEGIAQKFGKPSVKLDNPENISAKEKDALLKLKDALKS